MRPDIIKSRYILFDRVLVDILSGVEILNPFNMEKGKYGRIWSLPTSTPVILDNHQQLSNANNLVRTGTVS